jgi:oligopeptide/dipeptide ABC transporter ATP-binding protein
MSQSTLLEVRNLAVGIDAPPGVQPVLQGISFDLREGEILGVVGESGAGKSTLARAIVGLTRRPARLLEGSAEFGAQGDLLKLNPRARRALACTEIGYVGQNPFGSLHPILSIGKQFENTQRAHDLHLTRREMHDRAVEALTRVGLREPDRVLRGYAHELSGGMAQRVVMAIAFLLGPRLVVADEPTTGLDLTVQRQILELMVDMARRTESGVVLVTHDLGIVAHFCERVMVLYGGHLVELGPVATVFAKPWHPYTEMLLAAVPGSALTRRPVIVHEAGQAAQGCVFRNRCPYAAEKCAIEPELAWIEADRLAACHRASALSRGMTWP